MLSAAVVVLWFDTTSVALGTIGKLLVAENI